MTNKSRRSSNSNRKRPGTGRQPVIILVSTLFLAAIAFFLFKVVGLSEHGSELDRLTAFDAEGDLTFVAAPGDTIVTVDIEIADTDEDRQVGLMFRRKFGDDQGMLFIFPDQNVRSFWMKNTKLSLDMLFADSTGLIVTIHERTQPQTRKNYFSKPAVYVVEVNAGFVEKHGIAVGDRIVWQRN